MRDCTIDGPKFFREMRNVELENVVINDADETFWKIDGLKLKNVKLHEGTYPFMFSKNIYVDGLESDAKYVFQYCKNVEIHNANIVTKDSFWECENITIYDSTLDGEYLAWHSKNVRLVNCHLAGEQLLCYTDNFSAMQRTWYLRIAPLMQHAIVYLSMQRLRLTSRGILRTSRTPQLAILLPIPSVV